jgi:hypothetical protein
VNPDRPGLRGSGKVNEPDPVTGLAANFSPIPLIAPPPFGSETDSAEKCPFGWLVAEDSLDFMQN